MNATICESCNNPFKVKFWDASKFCGPCKQKREAKND